MYFQVLPSTMVGNVLPSLVHVKQVAWGIPEAPLSCCQNVYSPKKESILGGQGEAPVCLSCHPAADLVGHGGGQIID